MTTIKRITERTITAAVIIALIVALLFGTLAAVFTARADDEFIDTKEFARVSLDVSNPQFSESSGSYPAAPTSWTGEGNGNVIRGVIDLTPDKYTGDDSGNKEFKLDRYPEYSTEDTIPVTPFGNKIGDVETDKKTLFLNTVDGAEAVYAYSSSSMTLEANSFYHFSAWVKTGDFAENTGATIKIDGLGKDCAFRNIDTVKNLKRENGIPVLTKANNYGFVEYSFYIRTSASLSKSVTISLGLGDSLDENDPYPTVMPRAASGYAFFDTVTAERISSYDYAFMTEGFTKTGDGVYSGNNGTSLALDLYDTSFLTTDDGGNTVEIGTFSNIDSESLNNGKYWNANASYDDSENPEYAGAASVSIYNSATRLAESDFDDDSVKLTKNPWAPLGRAEYDVRNKNFVGGTNGNILTITAINGTAARGVASPDVVINRYKYYRFSVWVKGDGIVGGSGISIGVKGEKNDTAANNTLAQWYNNLDGDSADTAHYGWKEQVIYIQGSKLSDLTVHFELWLGTPSSRSSGVAMFDNVTFTEVSYSDFTAMSAADGGNVLSLDGEATDTGIANGTFESIGDYDEFAYPLPAAEWSYKTAESVMTTGFSSAPVKVPSRAAHGIIPTDDKTFNMLRQNGDIPAIVRNPVTFDSTVNNALILASDEKTAFCYQSAAITAAVDKAYKLTVDMAVSGVSQDGYGASLVLKTSSGSVVATIEGIRDTHNAFKTYTFYIAAPLNQQTLNVEIWLGLNDRVNNTHKLSDGCVYVKRVALNEWTAAESTTVEAEYETLLNDYREALADENRLRALDYAMISFSSPSFDYYDAYSYNLGIAHGTPYNWSFGSAKTDGVKNGLIDLGNVKELPYKDFDKKDQTGTMLYMYNTEPNRSTYTYGNEISLVSNTYYRLDVTVKVRVSEDIRKGKDKVGANIKLTGTAEESFTNIKDTTTLVDSKNEDSRDYESFKTYTFYIASGDNGGDIGLEISLGDDDNYVSGVLVVSDVTLTSINNSTYDSAKKNLDSKYEIAVSLSDANSGDSDDNSEPQKPEIAWWIIPTVIFSVCLLAAIVLIIVMRIRDRVKKKKTTVYSTEYDRNAALDELDKLAANNDETADGKTDEPYADVDDAHTTAEEKEETTSEEAETDNTAEADASEVKTIEQKPASDDELDD